MHPRGRRRIRFKPLQRLLICSVFCQLNKEVKKALVSLAGIVFPIAGMIITAIALSAVLSTHWAWGVPFVFIGVMFLIIGLVIPLLQ